MNRLLYRFVFFLAVLSGLKFSAAYGQVFKNGDRVCFVGNSITMNGEFYHQLALYYATRHPDRRVDFINCGINGNFSNNVLSRMDEDILVHRPAWAVVMLGMNDVRRELYHPDSAAVPGIERRREQALEVYKNNYELIVKRFLDAGVKVILQTPSIYDQTAELPAMSYVGRNGALLKCSGIVMELAKKHGLLVVDYQRPMLAVNKLLQLADPSATLIGADRVHPGAAGHMVMALTFLAATEKPVVPEIYRVPRAVKGTGKQSIYFVENTLPYPLSAEQQKMSSILGSKFTGHFVRFNGLAAGSYRLHIDSTGIGTYTQAQLVSGLDMSAITNAPQYVQAANVLALLRKYWELEAGIRYLRLVELYKQKPEKRYLELKPKQAEIEKQMRELLEQVHQVNRPQAHTWVFSPVASTNSFNPFFICDYR